MKKWVWTVTPNNWEVIKKNKVWAVNNKMRTSRATKGDLIIFYVKETYCFKGVFKIQSEWYVAKEPIWTGEELGKINFPYQCKLKLVKLGNAPFKEMLNELNFIKNKEKPSSVFRGHRVGPANYGNAIPETDYEIILKNM